MSDTTAPREKGPRVFLDYDQVELDRCYEAGANSVVRKSLVMEELRAKMSKVYEFWITVNEANRASRV